MDAQKAGSLPELPELRLVLVGTMAEEQPQEGAAKAVSDSPTAEKKEAQVSKGPFSDIYSRG